VILHAGIILINMNSGAMWKNYIFCRLARFLPTQRISIGNRKHERRCMNWVIWDSCLFCKCSISGSGIARCNYKGVLYLHLRRVWVRRNDAALRFGFPACVQVLDFSVHEQGQWPVYYTSVFMRECQLVLKQHSTEYIVHCNIYC
jgi:hypothetical protein